MADKTFTEALAENELVDGTPGVNQEAITGEEIVGATSNTTLDSGWKFKTLRSWVAKFPDLMLKSVYDTNDDGIVNESGGVNNGAGGSKTATEIVNHIDDGSIHFVINDGSVSASVAWSASKINTELGTKADQSALDSHVNDLDIHRPVNDLATTTTNLWSASKINTQKADQSALNAHTGDSSIHFVINDGSVSASVAWSASKIDTELGNKADQSALDSHINTLNIHRVMDDAQTTSTTLWSSSKIDTEKTDQTDFDGHVGDSTHLATNERNAIDAANAPSGSNAFATIADVGIQNVVEDTTPELGGDLYTRNNDIVFQDSTISEIGAAGTIPGDDGVYFVRSRAGTYDPDDGGIGCRAGVLELGGGAVQIPSLKGTDLRDVQVSDEGILYAAELPQPGWEVSDTSTYDHDFGLEKTTGPWVEVVGLEVNPAQDVAAGERLDIYVELYVENVEDKAGTIEIGIGVDGATPTIVGASKSVGPEALTYVPVSWSSTTHGGITTGQTIDVFARRGTSVDDAHLYLRGSQSAHELIVTIPGSGGGGGSGDVIGPGSAIADNLAAYNGTTGKLIKDAGYAMPAGGASGEVLTKNSATDYDWDWAPGGGGGGIPEAPDDSFGYVRLGATTNSWARGSRVTEAATAPTNPSVGDVWIDTT